MIEFAGHSINEKRRELLFEGSVVPIGERAFDVLLALAAANGAVVTRDDLMSKVWPGQIINDNALEAQIHSVRRALGSHRTAVKTAPGRGYYLANTSVKETQRTNLEADLSELVDRDPLIADLCDQIVLYRSVTLVGCGGIGKTGLASALGKRLLSRFKDGVWFIELSAIEKPGLIPATIAAVIGLSASPSSDVANLALSLRDSEALLILDNCEHLVEAVALCGSQLLLKCPKLRILSTSREALGLEGEVISYIPPLSLTLPQDDPAIKMDSAAVRLFLCRLPLDWGNRSLPSNGIEAIASICRRLDGIPLAIEMAAAVAGTIGIHEVERRLQKSFTLLGQGRRLATGRQQTLETTIAWSYNLLQTDEKCLFRRLGILSGMFSAEAVEAIIADEGVDALALLSSLVSKSLVVAEHREIGTLFKMLEAVRAYALDRLAENGEAEVAGEKHAAYFLSLFEDARQRLVASETDRWIETYSPHIHNARSALDWALSQRNNPGLGVKLVAALEPLWLQLSLVSEMLSRVQEALSSSSLELSTAELDMRLHTARGCALLYVQGPGTETVTSLERAWKLAESLGQHDYTFRCLWGLAAAADNAGQPARAWEYVEKLLAATKLHGSGTEALIAIRAAGAISHVLGDQRASRQYLEAFLSEYQAPMIYSPTKRFHFDQEVAAMAFYSRVLWLQGELAAGVSTATSAVERASDIGHIHSVCHALAQARIPLALQSGDYDLAERDIGRLHDLAQSRGLWVWQVWSQAFRATFGIMRARFGEASQISRKSSMSTRTCRFACISRASWGIWLRLMRTWATLMML